MARMVSALIGLALSAAIFAGVIYLVFDINWFDAAHRAGMAQLTGLRMDQYQAGHFYLALAHVFGFFFVMAGTVVAGMQLPEHLQGSGRHIGKLRYAIYLLYPLVLACRLIGRGMARLLKIRVPRPRIEASIQWSTDAPAPVVVNDPGTSETRTAPVVDFNPQGIAPAPNTADVEQEAAQNDDTGEDSGLVYSDPMAESQPTTPALPKFQPDAGIAVVIDQCRELGFETRSNLIVNASHGGWSPDIFDNDPMATIQLVAVDESTIFLIETLDLGDAEWTVETMADMHNRPWHEARWKSTHGDIPCPVSNLVRSRERFSASLITRLGMEPDQVMPVLMLRKGSLANPEKLTVFAEAEEISVVWFDDPALIENVTEKANGKMSAVLLNIMTQASRQQAS